MKPIIKSKSIIASFLASVLLLTYSCNEYDFGDTNINPAAAEFPLPSALLTSAIWSISGYERSTTTSLYVQYLSETQYPETSLYATGPVNWGDYTGALQNLNTIIKINSDDETKEGATDYGSNANQIAVARILKAYLFSKVADQYGDIPYSEALNGEETPIYDSQESVYQSILTELKEAENQFDGGSMPAGDILLGGDKAQWKRLANSMRLVLSLRLSKRYPGAGDFAATEFNSALNDSDGIIDDNDNNVMYTHIADNNWANRWWSLFFSREDFAPSDVLVDDLKARNDPRLAVFVNKATNGEYVGLPYGYTRDQLINWTANNVFSRMGDNIRAQTSPSYMMTASYINLTRAEAAELGWTGENAAQLYLDGIQASWEQHGVFDQAAFTAYIADPQNVYAGNELEQIGNQKWLSLYPDGFEMWCDWRRTGFPALTPTPNYVNETGIIPLRYNYPSTEQTLNEENYQSAVSRLANGDKDNSPVWWDN